MNALQGMDRYPTKFSFYNTMFLRFSFFLSLCDETRQKNIEKICILTSSCLLFVNDMLYIPTSSWVLLILYTLYLITINCMSEGGGWQAELYHELKKTYRPSTWAGMLIFWNVTEATWREIGIVREGQLYKIWAFATTLLAALTALAVEPYKASQFLS